MIHASSYWSQHFTNNLTVQRVDWNQDPKITPEQKASIIYSLKAWQLGETSDGKHLLAAATRHAHRTGDPEYINAVKLFIKEEQKHGSNLGKYIDLMGEKRAQKDWGGSARRELLALGVWTEKTCR